MTTMAQSGAQAPQQTINGWDDYPRSFRHMMAESAGSQIGASVSLNMPRWLPPQVELPREIVRRASSQVNQRTYREAAIKSRNNPISARILSDASAIMMLAQSAATPEPAIAAEIRLGCAHVVADKLRAFLDDLARKEGMPVATSEVTKRLFVSDGKTRVCVRQLIARIPAEVAAYADASSVAVDDWIERLPIAERQYFDDDIHCDIHWAQHGNR